METGDEYQDEPWNEEPEYDAEADFEQSLIVDIIEEFDSFLYVHNVDLHNPEPHDDVEDDHIIYGKHRDELISGLKGVLKQYGLSQ